MNYIILKTYDLLLKTYDLLARITFNEWIDLLQFLIAFGTIWLLYKTFITQKQSNEAQLKAVELDQWTKRAEHLPSVLMQLSTKYPEATYSVDEHGFPINDLGGDRALCLNIHINRNSITRLNLKTTVSQNEFTVNHQSQIVKEAFYSEGVEIELRNLITFTATEAISLRSETDSPSATFTIYFKDLVGNDYTQSLEYRFPEIISVTEMVQLNKI